MELNHKVKAMASSATLALSALAREMRLAGKDVIDLGAGEPDIPSSAYICEAGIKAIQEGFTKYPPVDGFPELKEAIFQKTCEDIGGLPEDFQVIVGTGAKQILFNALMATLNAGDEVIIPAPYWVSYPSMVGATDGTAVIVHPSDKRALKLSATDLERHITGRTKWLIFNSPANPTGLAYTEAELKAIGAVLKETPHVWILCDDIYKDLCYEEIPHLAAVCPFLKERLLIVDGVSKAFAMTGWRIGFGLGPSKVIGAIKKLQGQQTSGACSVAQKTALAALRGRKKWFPEMRAMFQERRDFLDAGLQKLGLSCPKPSGAFYLYADCRKFLGLKTPQGKRLNTDADVSEALLS